MKPLTRLELQALLLAEGLDPGPAQRWAVARPEPGSPWFVRALVAFGAWLAGLMMAVGLTTLLNLEHSGPGLVLAGLCFCAAACTLRWASEGDFPVQLALATSLAGQFLVAGGLSTWDLPQHGLILSGSMLGLEVLLILLFRDPKQRVLATAAAGCFLCLGLHELQRAWLGAPLLGIALLGWWLIPPGSWSARTAPFRRPVLYGLAAAFCWPHLRILAPELFAILDNGQTLELAPWGPERILAALAPGLLLGAASLAILRRPELRPAPRTLLVPILAWLGLTLAGFQAPGVPAMLFVLALAIEAREPILAALAGVAASGFLAFFYYDLASTLLAKAASLLALGALLLALRIWLGTREKPC